MSKKHFNSIAATIAEEVRGHHYVIEQSPNSEDVALHAYAIAVLAATAERLAEQFGSFNANFDRQRFLNACALRA